MNPLQAIINRQGVVILDGGLATELETRGHDLSSQLWSARLLQDDPDAITQVHLAYLEAGADCIVSASYQASFPGFAALGIGRQAATELMQLSVQLAVDARDQFLAKTANRPHTPLIAASIGPYGAYLANGAEYTGDCGVGHRELVDFHRPRLEALAATQADLLAVETIPNYQETLVLSDLLAEAGKPAWVCFSCRDDKHLNDGTPIAACVDALADVDAIVGIGVNCTPPAYLGGLITTIRHRTDKTSVVYPNSGESYDGHHRCWRGNASAADYAEWARDWLARGATAIGGCCRTGPEHVRLLRDTLAPQ